MNKEKNPSLTKATDIETSENNKDYSGFFKIADVDGFRATFGVKNLERNSRTYHIGTVAIETQGRIESLEDHIRYLENHLKNMKGVDNKIEKTMIDKEGILMVIIAKNDDNNFSKLGMPRKMIANFEAEIAAKDIIMEINNLLNSEPMTYNTKIIYKAKLINKI